MEQDQRTAAFVAKAQERIKGTFIELLGIRLLEVNQAQAVSEMTFVHNLQQLTGVFHAGALITLADTTATFAALYWASGNLDTDRFPFTIQLSTNLLRNTNRDTIRAVATPIHRGRTTMVVDTRVSDAEGRLLLLVTTTHVFIGG
jgi:uncharacterized protein (TIGR00369 family)